MNDTVPRGRFVTRQEARQPGPREKGSGLAWRGTGEGQLLAVTAFGAELVEVPALGLALPGVALLPAPGPC